MTALCVDCLRSNDESISITSRVELKWEEVEYYLRINIDLIIQITVEVPSYNLRAAWALLMAVKAFHKPRV